MTPNGVNQTHDRSGFSLHHSLTAQAEEGAPGHMNFDDPDVALLIETVGNRTGLSLWTREELRRFPFLKLD